MHTACASSQARAGTRTVTSPGPPGSTVTSQGAFASVDVDRAPVTVPPVTSSTDAASSAVSPAGAPLNRSPTVNPLSPSWRGGRSSNTASGSALRGAMPITPAPLWSSTAGACVAALRIAPPPSTRAVPRHQNRAVRAVALDQRVAEH